MAAETSLESSYIKLRKASSLLAGQNALEKNAALEKVAAALDLRRNEILEANKTDVENARLKGISESLIDRLALNSDRIDSILESLKIN